MRNSKTKLLFTGIKNFTIIFLLQFSFNKSYAQARWQADVSVTSVTITPVLKKISRVTDNINKPDQKVVQAADDNLKCTIMVHNENDDDASGTKMVIILPVEVSVVSLPANATLDPSVSASQPFAGYILVDIGHMAVQQNVTIEFTITKSKYGNKVGAYAYSDSPDPNPANNYRDATY